MGEKQKTLVVYGYHPEEAFSIEVGKTLEEILAAEPREGLLVTRYVGPNPREVDDRINGTPDSGRLLREFLSRFQGMDYVTKLHDELPTPMDEKEAEGFRRDYSPKDFPGLFAVHTARYQISRELVRGVLKLCSSQPFRCEYYFSANDMTEVSDYDDISICFYPHLLSKNDGVDFVRKLAPVLNTYERLVSND